MDINVTQEPEHGNYNTRSEQLAASSGIVSGGAGTELPQDKERAGEQDHPCVGKTNGGFVPSYLCVKDIMNRTRIPTCSALWRTALGEQTKK